MSLVEMSKRLKIPVSTLFDTLKEMEKHFDFTIVLRETEKDMSARETLPNEFTYQVSIENSTKG